VRTRAIAAAVVIVVISAGLTAHVVFARTGNEAAMWTAALLLWPAYLMRTAVGGSRRVTFAILAVAATLYYAALAAAVILPGRRITAAIILAAHAAGTALIGSMMAQILDIGRSMEGLQD
jgi:hypothetical protein